MTMIRQFNWARNWKKKVAPHVDDPEAYFWLVAGMKWHVPTWQPEEGPHLIGRGSINGQRVVNGKLSWYQPWGRCHWIAPFAWVLGRRIYPDLRWGIYTGEIHTIAIGCEPDTENKRLIFDILNFKGQTAEESINQVEMMNPRLVWCPEGIFDPEIKQSFIQFKDGVGHFNPTAAHAVASVS